MTCILLVEAPDLTPPAWSEGLQSAHWTVIRTGPPQVGCRVWTPEDLEEAPDLIVLHGLSALEQKLVTLRQWHGSRRRRFPPVLRVGDVMAESAIDVEGIAYDLPCATAADDLGCVAALLLGKPQLARGPRQGGWIARIWSAQERLLQDNHRPAAAVLGTRTVLERLLASRVDDGALAAAMALTLLPDGPRPLALWAQEFAPNMDGSDLGLPELPRFAKDRLRARLIRVGPQRFALPLDDQDQPLAGWPAPSAGVLDRAEGVAFIAWSPLMVRLSGFMGTALCRDGLHWLIPQPAHSPSTATQAGGR